MHCLNGLWDADIIAWEAGDVNNAGQIIVRGLASYLLTPIPGSELQQEPGDNSDSLPDRTLTVNIIGEGAVEPLGGDFAPGTVVKLTATANEGWTFVRWEGDADTTSSIAILGMDTDKSVTALFEPATVDQYDLLVLVVGGEGSVSPEPGPYPEGTVLLLEATPVPGWHFVEWQGALSGSDNPTSVTVDGPGLVIAVFGPDRGADDLSDLEADDPDQERPDPDEQGGYGAEARAINPCGSVGMASLWLTMFGLGCLKTTRRFCGGTPQQEKPSCHMNDRTGCPLIRAGTRHAGPIPRTDA